MAQAPCRGVQGRRRGDRRRNGRPVPARTRARLPFSLCDGSRLPRCSWQQANGEPCYSDSLDVLLSSLQWQRQSFDRLVNEATAALPADSGYAEKLSSVSRSLVDLVQSLATTAEQRGARAGSATAAAPQAHWPPPNSSGLLEAQVPAGGQARPRARGLAARVGRRAK